MKKYIEYYKNLPTNVRKMSFYLFLTYFFVLLTYPFTRSATQVYLLESYGAGYFPLTWFLSIVTLSLAIFISDKIQAKYGVHKLFSILSIISVIIFSLGTIFYKQGIKEMAFLLFIWKEVYIVILIHLCLAFCNAFFTLDQMKFLYGPLGAMGSLGGIFGGQLTSLLAKTNGTDSVMYASFSILVLSLISFRKTAIFETKGALKEKINLSPLQATKDIKGYVFLIASIVGLSQFIINITDFEFNIIFEKVVKSNDEKSFYLGQLYSIVNIVSLIIQFLFMPLILNKIKTRTTHIFVPLFYLGLIIFGFGIGGAFLLPVATVFVGMKAVDYSLFTVVKEFLYYPLTKIQKYGAKYIADMFTYRTAKALIALMLMFVNSLFVLSVLQFLFILMWLVCVILLFRKYKDLGVNNEPTTKT